MDGTVTYQCNSERRFLPPPASVIQFLSTLADHRVEAEQIQNGDDAEYAVFNDKSAVSLFIDHRQTGFAGSFDNKIPYMDNAVDYAEQL